MYTNRSPSPHDSQQHREENEKMVCRFLTLSIVPILLFTLVSLVTTGFIYISLYNNNRNTLKMGSSTHALSEETTLEINPIQTLVDTRWKNCTFNLNYTQSTRRSLSQYQNFFNNNLLAPVIDKVECDSILFFSSHNDFDISHFGMFYNKIGNGHRHVNKNIFLEAIQYYYPITSVFQVMRARGSGLDLCKNVTELIDEISATNPNKTLFKLDPNFKFNSCEDFFCSESKDHTIDPVTRYLQNLDYQSIFYESSKRSNFFDDLFSLSVIVNRCQYCRSEKSFRKKVMTGECPFMLDFPTRAAERSCLGRRGFPIFYPFFSLDQYLQFTGNPFLCYCHDLDKYATRCDTMSYAVYQMYDFTSSAEVYTESFVIIVIFMVLILPIIKEAFRKGRYFFKSTSSRLNLMAIIPFASFRLIFIGIYVGGQTLDLNSSNYEHLFFVYQLVMTAVDIVGVEFVFVSISIQWNQIYEKLRVMDKPTESIDLGKKQLFLSSKVFAIIYYSILLGCSATILLLFILLSTYPTIFYEFNTVSASDILIPITIALIFFPMIMSTIAFAILSILIQCKLKQRSEVSFVSTNYTSSAAKYICVSWLQLLATLVQVFTLYFGYDSISAFMYYTSFIARFIITEIFEYYVIVLLADRTLLKELYVDLIWNRLIKGNMQRLQKKDTHSTGTTVTMDTTTTSIESEYSEFLN